MFMCDRGDPHTQLKQQQQQSTMMQQAQAEQIQSPTQLLQRPNFFRALVDGNLSKEALDAFYAKLHATKVVRSVAIVSSQTSYSNEQEFTIYMLKVYTEMGDYIVDKRYREFRSLREELKQQHKDLNLKEFPRKKLFSSMKQKTIEERVTLLNYEFRKKGIIDYFRDSTKGSGQKQNNQQEVQKEIQISLSSASNSESRMIEILKKLNTQQDNSTNLFERMRNIYFREQPLLNNGSISIILFGQGEMHGLIALSLRVSKEDSHFVCCQGLKLILDLMDIKMNPAAQAFIEVYTSTPFKEMKKFNFKAHILLKQAKECKALSARLLRIYIDTHGKTLSKVTRQLFLDDKCFEEYVRTVKVQNVPRQLLNQVLIDLLEDEAANQTPKNASDRKSQPDANRNSSNKNPTNNSNNNAANRQNDFTAQAQAVDRLQRKTSQVRISQIGQHNNSFSIRGGEEDFRERFMFKRDSVLDKDSNTFFEPLEQDAQIACEVSQLKDAIDDNFIDWIYVYQHPTCDVSLARCSFPDKFIRIKLSLPLSLEESQMILTENRMEWDSHLIELAKIATDDSGRIVSKETLRFNRYSGQRMLTFLFSSYIISEGDSVYWMIETNNYPQYKLSPNEDLGKWQKCIKFKEIKLNRSHRTAKEANGTKEEEDVNHVFEEENDEGQQRDEGNENNDEDVITEISIMIRCCDTNSMVFVSPFLLNDDRSMVGKFVSFVETVQKQKLARMKNPVSTYDQSLMSSSLMTASLNTPLKPAKDLQLFPLIRSSPLIQQQSQQESQTHKTNRRRSSSSSSNSDSESSDNDSDSDHQHI